MGFGAVDGHHLLAVDFTERVERRARAQRHIGTVTTASSTPKTTIGTSAVSSVRIRLFTPPRVDGAPWPAPRFTDSVIAGYAPATQHEYG